MVDLVMYEFKNVHTKKITPKELFMNDYTEEIHETEQVFTSAKQLRGIIDDKYENSD